MAKFDLEERTIRFAQDVRVSSKKLLNSPVSSGDARQLLKSSGSVGAKLKLLEKKLRKVVFGCNF